MHMYVLCDSHLDVCGTELTMDQWVMGQGSRGSWVSLSNPLSVLVWYAVVSLPTDVTLDCSIPTQRFIIVDLSIIIAHVHLFVTLIMWCKEQ
jgi:threonine/homoserine/homoserine lactone efflux protein